ncbi:hypothetical protein ACHAWF_018045 [Thalassiosira exigua]
MAGTYCQRTARSHAVLASRITWSTCPGAQSMSGAPRPCRRHMSSEPFYGFPLPPSSRYEPHRVPTRNVAASGRDNLDHIHLPPLALHQRIGTFVHSSLTALSDPTRADAVAAVGEVTGSFALSRMRAGMERDEVGRRILRERPTVDEGVARRAFELLRERGDGSNPVNGGRGRGMTFGAAYAAFLQTHNFDPRERSPVRFIPNELSYVMVRYRQCHDYWHVLTGLPPTVLGELALKWLELIQTGLPLAALSATGGALGVSGLGPREREALWSIYLPWAVRVGGDMRPHGLMCVYYEEELGTSLDVLRDQMGITEVAPTVKLH